MVGNEKETLAAALGGITVEAGTKGKTANANAAATLSRGERYQDSMFRDVCAGFLEAYADVVARVNANALDDGPYSRATLAFKTDLASVLVSSTSAQCQVRRVGEDEILEPLPSSLNPVDNLLFPPSL